MAYLIVKGENKQYVFTKRNFIPGSVKNFMA